MTKRGRHRDAIRRKVFVILLFCLSVTLSYGQYVDPADAGVRNAVLVNILNEYRPSTVPLTSQMMPYVAYVTEEDRINDVMFDAMLIYIPFSEHTDSNNVFSFSGKGINKYYEFLFDAVPDSIYPPIQGVCGSFLRQLDDCVRIRNASLSIDDKFNIILTIPYFVSHYSKIPNAFSSFLTNRRIDLQKQPDVFVKEIIDEFSRRFTDEKYRNLRLIGFYWYHEYVYGSKMEKTMIEYASDYLRSKRLKFYCSPYIVKRDGAFTSTISPDVVDRFDAIWLQPGFWSRGYSGPGYKGEDSARLIFAASEAYKKRWGINMEFHGGKNSNYYRYLSYGKEAGYIWTSKLFYETNGFLWYTSKYLREMYEKTYSFIADSRKERER